MVVNKNATVEDHRTVTKIVLELYPEIDLAKNKVGVFSRNVKLDATVRDKDRIEITVHYWLIQEIRRSVLFEQAKAAAAKS